MTKTDSTAPALDLRDHLEQAPMSPYQWAIVAAAVLLNALDGFDVAAMSFVSARVEQEFGLSGTVLGVVISATLVGMALGSVLIGRVADVIGRRITVLGSVALATAGMYLAATAQDVVQLGVWRVLTGLGVGGILTSITVITAEFSSRRWRGLAIGIYTAGYGVGATLGGIAAVGLQEGLGWRGVFLAGAVASTVLLAALLFVLPESVHFLRLRGGRRAGAALRRIARLVGFDPERAEPAAAVAGEKPASARPGLGGLLSREVLASTLLLWASFFTVMFAFYFVNSWTPRLMVEAGMTVDQGVVVGMALAIGGAVGSVLYGALAARLPRERLLLVFLLLSAAAIVVFVLSTAVLALAFGLGVVVGLLVNGCIAGLYTVAPTRYGTDVRATGVGAALGVGRAGAILAPIAAGALLEAGWTNVALYSSTAALLVVGAAAILLLARRPAPEAR
ncbi:MFS transporter [Microbacterium marinilacus]|uniref:Aromatic acid/H+ symport family MFS transporter n=1 Tax=Microbacterium marinilacus TaxID=415209 RepID=A0ABP7BT81_9MICO|nr:MFS transporter [Microbacterium marinilacus]MBY0689180.1 MFS transporter [Microbacterium marinilacus]